MMIIVIMKGVKADHHWYYRYIGRTAHRRDIVFDANLFMVYSSASESTPAATGTLQFRSTTSNSYWTMARCSCVLGPGATAADISDHLKQSETKNMACIAGLFFVSIEAINYPCSDSQPIKEFNREIIQAFPNLYLISNAEYLAPRLPTVTRAEYFKHLLQFDDLRWDEEHGHYSQILHFRQAMRGSPQYWVATKCN